MFNFFIFSLLIRSNNSTFDCKGTTFSSYHQKSCNFFAFVHSIHLDGDIVKALSPASFLTPSNSRGLKQGLNSCSQIPRNSIVLRLRNIVSICIVAEEIASHLNHQRSQHRNNIFKLFWRHLLYIIRKKEKKVKCEKKKNSLCSKKCAEGATDHRRGCQPPAKELHKKKAHLQKPVILLDSLNNQD